MRECECACDVGANFLLLGWLALLLPLLPPPPPPHPKMLLLDPFESLRFMPKDRNEDWLRAWLGSCPLPDRTPSTLWLRS